MCRQLHFWHPCHVLFPGTPVVSVTLRSPANFWHPSGMLASPLSKFPVRPEVCIASKLANWGGVRLNPVAFATHRR